MLLPYVLCDHALGLMLLLSLPHYTRQLVPEDVEWSLLPNYTL